MKLLVCIPTLTGREAYLDNCIRAYRERTAEDVEVLFSIVRDAPTCGIGWNECALKGTDCGPDLIHFSNDDIVVGEGWFEPMLLVAQYGNVPAPRIEPAGVHLGEFPIDKPPMAPSGSPAPISSSGYYYADLPENQPKHEWEEVDHGALPFCTLYQWLEIGPFIPIHFGTDKWFYRKAREYGMKALACPRSVIYNYAPQIGRARHEWTERDYLDFDLNVAYPLYVSGQLDPREEHPLRGTAVGLALAREWRAKNVL